MVFLSRKGGLGRIFGLVAAAAIAGDKGAAYDPACIPAVIFTDPEIASVGRTEEELKAAGTAYRKGTFPFAANGRARALGDTTGMVKMTADAATDEVLGVHMIGPHVGELIAEAAVIMEFGGSAEDLARTCHAHPTMSEAVKEAAMGVAKRSIHV